jgi:hypothetical protein
MRPLKAICLLFVSVWSVYCVQSQDLSNSYFEVEALDVERNNGSTVIDNRLALSSDGFLWYTTNNGVVKDYGTSSVLYAFDKKQGIASSEFYDIFEDSSEQLWIGTNQGLYKLDAASGQGNWIQWRYPESGEVAHVVDIAEDINGDIIYTTSKNYVLRYLREEKRVLSYRISDDFMRKAKEGEPHDLYQIKIENITSDGVILLSRYDVIFIFKEGKILPLRDYSSEPKNIDRPALYKISEDGDLFASGTSGSYAFQGDKYFYEYVAEINKQIVKLPSYYVERVENKHVTKQTNYPVFVTKDPLSQKRLLLFQMNTDTSILEQLPQQYEFKDVIVDFGYTPNSAFYVSTLNGVYRMYSKSSVFKKYLTDSEVREVSARISTRGFAENSTGDIYVGSYAGLFKLSETKGAKIIPIMENMFPSRPFLSYGEFYVESDSIFWIAGDTKGLERMNVITNRYTSFPFANTLNVNNPYLFRTLEPLDDQKILLGSDHGLYEFDIQTKVYTDRNKLNDSTDISETYIKDIKSIGRDLWIGTEGDGLYILNKDSREVLHLNKDVGLASNTAYVIHQSTSGSVYIGSDNGLSIIDPTTKKEVLYREYDGLSGNKVVGILEDEIGIWLSTYKGLICYHKDEDWFYNFFEKDGLPDNEFNQNSFFKASTGRLYFGGLNGVVSFRSDEIDFTKANAQIKIISAEFYDAEKDSITTTSVGLKSRLKTVVLPYEKNFFNTTFAISEPLNPAASSFQYQLEGMHSDWIDLGNTNNLRLLAIPPGNYTLRLRGDDASGNPSINEVRIPIEVEEIFYKTWWFLVLNILGVAIMLLGFYQFRKYRWSEKFRQQRKVDQLESKALRAQMNPHFMFNALNGLQSIMILKGEREANKYLGAFSRLLRSSLDMSKSDTISLEEEIQYLESYLSLESMRQARPFESMIAVIPEDMDVQSILIPCMLFQPILENAIIHGLAPKRDGTPKLTIVFKEDNNLLIGIVTDNGIGREAAAVLKAKNRKTHKSWATEILKERIEIINRYTNMNVDFTIKDLYVDGVSAGTEVTLRLPIL